MKSDPSYLYCSPWWAKLISLNLFLRYKDRLLIFKCRLISRGVIFDQLGFEKGKTSKKWLCVKLGTFRLPYHHQFFFIPSSLFCTQWHYFWAFDGFCFLFLIPSRLLFPFLSSCESEGKIQHFLFVNSIIIVPLSWKCLFGFSFVKLDCCLLFFYTF